MHEKLFRVSNIKDISEEKKSNLIIRLKSLKKVRASKISFKYLHDSVVLHNILYSKCYFRETDLFCFKIFSISILAFVFIFLSLLLKIILYQNKKNNGNFYIDIV